MFARAISHAVRRFERTPLVRRPNPSKSSQKRGFRKIATLALRSL